MAIKKYHLVLCFAILFTMAVTMVIVSTPAVAAESEDTAVEKVVEAPVSEVPEEGPEESGTIFQGNGNNLDISKLRTGDIILTKNAVSFFMPGGWTHSLIYYGYGWAIEANAQGVVWCRASAVRGASVAAIYRVRTSSSVKYAARNFAARQLGKPYDFKWLTWIGGKEVYGGSYYCSELCWAGYKAYGVDIDRNPGWSWTYGRNVAPRELADDYDTYRVAYSS
jgi:uncharacterized protein YycO